MHLGVFKDHGGALFNMVKCCLCDICEDCTKLPSGEINFDAMHKRLITAVETRFIGSFVVVLSENCIFYKNTVISYFLILKLVPHNYLKR